RRHNRRPPPAPGQAKAPTPRGVGAFAVEPVPPWWTEARGSLSPLTRRRNRGHLPSERGDAGGLRALLALTHLEAHALVLVQAAESVHLDLRVVDEHVGGAVVRGDETKALLSVEPLHSAFCHALLLLQCPRLRLVHRTPGPVSRGDLDGS